MAVAEKEIKALSDEMPQGERHAYAKAQFNSSMVMVRCVADNADRELAGYVFRNLLATCKFLSRKHGFDVQ